MEKGEVVDITALDHGTIRLLGKVPLLVLKLQWVTQLRWRDLGDSKGIPRRQVRWTAFLGKSSSQEG